MKAKIDIIGNGSSNILYKRTGFTVVACNVPQHTYEYDYLSIIDDKPIVWMSQNDYTPLCPVLCLEKNIRTVENKSVKGDWRAVYTYREKWNSGLHAAQHFAPNFDQVNLWGFDSLYSEDLSSQMDSVVPRRHRPQLNKWWRPAWTEIIEANPKTEFVIHIPQGEHCAISKENVTIRQASMAMA